LTQRRSFLPPPHSAVTLMELSEILTAVAC
jgi:hypothetical protein